MGKKKDVQQFWEFKNSLKSDDEATLYVYGDIVTYDLEDWNWPDDVVPNKFKNELNALGDIQTINVRINSSGGSVFAAYAIMNLLKSHPAEIIVYIDGIAASAATLIAMAGDKIIAPIGSVLMIHLPSTGVRGNINDMQKTIDVLNTITESMIDVYHAKTGIDKTTLRVMLDEDSWMTGSQALEKGFVDEITDLEVVAYLSEDKKTAFFNEIGINLKKVRNKDVLMAMLPSHPKNKSTNVQNKKEEYVMVMNLAVLQANYPDIYTEVFNMGMTHGTSPDTISQARNEGRTEGIAAERKRIQEIDNIALPGMEALTNKAKFETCITAEAYAMELIKSQKEQGVNFLNASKADAIAAGLDGIPAAGEQFNNDDAEVDALLASLAKEDND